MTIPTHLDWTETAVTVQVIYYPVFDDGSLGHRQECSLPWQGDTAASETELVIQAQSYFDAKHGRGQERVEAARLWDKAERRYLTPAAA